MTRARRGVALLAGALIALTSAPAPAASPKAAAGFSVSGKPGPFIKQIAGRRFEQAGGAGRPLGLASDAINQGQFQAARLRMPQTEAQLKALLGRIEGNWPYAKGQPLQVHVLGVEDYSALALPDGSVVVGFGLLDRAQSDDEVAFVLAHELSHVRLGHFAKLASLQQERRTGSRLGQLYTMGSALHSGARDISAGGTGVGAFNAESSAAGQRAAATNDLLRFVNDSMRAPAWSRSQEDEADALGFDLAQLASYSAEAASAHVFDTIQADADNRRAMTAKLNQQLKSELGRAAGQGAVQGLLGGGVSAGGLARGLFRSAGRVASAVAADSEPGPKHRTPEERKKGVADYSSDAYPDGLPLREEQLGWLQALRSTREFADARTTVSAVRAAMKARADGDYPVAEREIGKALQTSFRTAPLVVNESARLRADMGEAARADALFTAAHASPDQTIDGYIDHVRMLYRAGDNDRALEVIQAGTQRYNDEKPFLSLLVAVSRQSGRQDEADRYLERCVQVGDAGLTKDCELAAGGAASGPKLQVPFSIPRLPF